MKSVELGNLCRPRQWPVVSQKHMNGEGFPVFGANGQIGWYTEFTHSDETIAVGCRGSCGEVHLVPPRSYINGNAMALDELDESRVDRRFLFRWLKHRGFRDVISGTSQPQIIQANIKRVEVPLPPLSEQRRIAAILDEADLVRRKHLRMEQRFAALGRAAFLRRFGDPNRLRPRDGVALGSICEISSGATPSRTNPAFYGGQTAWVKTGEVTGSIIEETEERVTDSGRAAARLRLYSPGTILIAMYGQGKTRGQVAMLGIPATINQACAAISCSANVRSTFMFVQLKIMYESIRRLGQGGNQPNLNAGLIRDLRVIAPALDVQLDFEAFVIELQREQRVHVMASARADTLFSSLQCRAFRGGL